MNPFLPPLCCIPDGESHVFGDRVYLYGSCDIPGDSNYCSHTYQDFSASVFDLEHWTDHGEIFASAGPNAQVAWTSARLYAPDVLYKDGQYYLYFCTGDGTEGMARSGSPSGPFTDARQLFYPPSILNGRPLSQNDPAVLLDDDGSAYLYWGEGQVQAARLKDNLYELDPMSYVENLIDEAHFGFHEGASIRKFNGKYYLLFCSVATGRASSLDYAISDAPLGPFRYGGTVIDNTGCDPETWNIHGSLAEIGEKYYVFYHRSSENSRFSRRACVEEITLRADNSIPAVSMSSAGFAQALNAAECIPALAGCRLSGRCYFTLEAGVPILSNIHHGDTALYTPLDFPTGLTQFCVTLRGKASGRLSVRTGSSDGPILAEVSLSNANERWTELRTAIQFQPAGRFGLYLCFEGGSSHTLCEISRFRFI